MWRWVDVLVSALEAHTVVGLFVSGAHVNSGDWMRWNEGVHHSTRDNHELGWSGTTLTRI